MQVTPFLINSLCVTDQTFINNLYIKGSIGTLFGIRYKVKGPIKNEEFELQNILEMPPRYDEHFKRTISSSQFTCDAVEGMKTPSMFSFENDIDFVVGKYTFIVHLKGVELLRKTIEIID